MARKRWTEPGRFEALLFSFSTSYRLMRVLRPVVCSQAPIVLSREPDRVERCRIGSQPVSHNPARRKAVLLKQFHHEFLCGLCIASALDEEIQHLTLVVDRPPEPVFTAADRNHHFIEVPMIARLRPRTADIRRDRRPELQEPPPDRLVGCVNTSLGQQFLDIPKGQCEPGIEPDRVADDFWREAVALKRYRSHPMMLIGDEPQSYPSYRDIASLDRRGLGSKVTQAAAGMAAALEASQGPRQAFASKGPAPLALVCWGRRFRA